VSILDVVCTVLFDSNRVYARVTIRSGSLRNRNRKL